MDKNEEQPKLFPVQATLRPGDHQRATVRESVYLKAYEVYSLVWSPQPRLVTGDCRGGFSTGELIAFLYASSFPRHEWRKRVDEALTGLHV
ncbi:hypothetical protein LCGC14_0795430 [marine sediment metagenome]|uniref:Uncharacterized protein n=2 Tax=root TaxID=1 RepID=A0A9C9THK0_9HYPH|nr:hypothetical protein [Aurantimonas coralicida]